MNKPKQTIDQKDLSNISTKALKIELENRAGRREITKEIIKAIAGATTITLGMLLAPQATSVICKIIYDQNNRGMYNHDKIQIKQAINRLRDHEIISMFEKNGETIIKLTQDGQKRLLKYQINDLELPYRDDWDGIWRIVLFDVPEHERSGRDQLRSLIKRLGMVELQHSVWLYPHSCKDELDFVSAYFGIGKYILYIETEKLENEIHYLELFKLKR